MMLAAQHAQFLYYKRLGIEQSPVKIEVTIFAASLLPYIWSSFPKKLNALNDVPNYVIL